MINIDQTTPSDLPRCETTFEEQILSSFGSMPTRKGALITQYTSAGMTQQSHIWRLEGKHIDQRLSTNSTPPGKAPKICGL